ncbi:MAG TPA: hypothetical protein PKH84_04860 [Thermomonas sp.]|uniref:hypothetical protein n=1 Tax=Thermomonas sp. TaxID=1971895 RepID=UPI002C0C2383|nr:hypothetical protein [Thermomonas sp.]HOC10913.1 hypothetical protein [Thermomonas sp.]
MRRKNVWLVLIALSGQWFSPAVIAQSDPWIEIADTTGSTYSGRKGSFETSTNKNGTPIGLIRGQVFDKKTKRYDYQQWYVTQADCANGMGKLVVIDTAGEFKFDADFIAQGKSAASAIADMICALNQAANAEKDGKGI